MRLLLLATLFVPLVVPLSGCSSTSSGDMNAPDDLQVSAQDLTSALADGGGDAASCVTPMLYPPTSSGIYCPFSYSGTDAGTEYCTNGSQMCCVSPTSSAGPSTCEAIGSSCSTPSFKVWQCGSPQDCVGAPVDGGGEPLVCCLVAGYMETTNTAGCPTTYKTAGGFDTITCTAASACTGTVQVPGATDGSVFTDYQYVVCEADADCVAAGAGTTCTPVKVSGTGIGVCEIILH